MIYRSYFIFSDIVQNSIEEYDIGFIISQGFIISSQNFAKKIKGTQIENQMQYWFAGHIKNNYSI